MTDLASLICERNDHPDAPACDGCYAMAAWLREHGYARGVTVAPALDVERLARALESINFGATGNLDPAWTPTIAAAIARAYGSAPAVEEGPTPLDAAYTERNAVVAALIRATGWRCWIADAPDASGWYIVYVDTPRGQVSWHFGPWDIGLFGDADGAPMFSARRDDDVWDGHTTEEKYARLAALPAPDALRAAAQAYLAAQEALVVWDAKHGYVINSERDALSGDVSETEAALRAALGDER